MINSNGLDAVEVEVMGIVLTSPDPPLRTVYLLAICLVNNEEMAAIKYTFDGTKFRDVQIPELATINGMRGAPADPQDDPHYVDVVETVLKVIRKLGVIT